ncbi:hypothetical protein [Nitrosomonas sp.]|uniref:hypothetical protein n=1 Tax=Nitrosomonas sp. TaxID=42353 RepID=UPI001E051009|nr:hypothetical protein [Nitrosomonas sp.]MBX3615673.1 hypothetical protein [Nitrosomonas sp.]
MYRSLSACTLAILSLVPFSALANGLSFSTATDFTTGHYGGTSATDIWYVPFTTRYDKDRASFRLIIPYLNITGPGNILGPGIGGIDGRETIIEGGFTGISSGSGGGTVVCDDNNEDCSGKNPGRSEDNSDPGGGGSDDGNNSGSGVGNGDDNDNSGTSGGNDDEGGGNSGSDDGSNGDDNSDPGSDDGSDDNDNPDSGNDEEEGDDDNSGSGGDDGSDDDDSDFVDGEDDDSGNDDGSSDDDGSDDDEDSSGSFSRIKARKIAAAGLIGGTPLGGPRLPSSTRSGLGDIITAFSYNLIDHAPTGVFFDITTRLKIPTASERQNMGTGKIDFAIQGDLFKMISKFTLSATLGYRILGNPSGITFHNVVYGGAGIGYRLTPAATLGTSYNMAQSPVGLEDSRDLTLYLSQRITHHFRLNVYGLRGFSERSPDWGSGINLRYVF